MAERKFRKKEDLFIKEKRRAKNFFITSSAKMSNDKNTKTTISSSVFTKMSQSFAEGEHLMDAHMLSTNRPILYMLQEMQQDIDDVYNEVSASAFEASYFPFATIDSGSIGVISSSLVPDKDDTYNLGSSTKEWHTSYMLTASIGGGIFTSASLAAGGGGGSVDLTRVDSTLAPDGDDTRDLGFANRQWRTLYLDGTANIDVLSADSFAKPPAPVVSTLTTLKSSIVPVSHLHTLVLNSSNTLSITGLIPAHSGQEITIMNIGSGAVTISRSTKNQARTIYGSGNITINQHEAYKFVCNPSQVWYQIS